MIGDDIRLAVHFHLCMEIEQGLERSGQGVRIMTFGSVPGDLRPKRGQTKTERYLNMLNAENILALEHIREAAVSPVNINGAFALRDCIVNSRTSQADIRTFPALI